MTRTTLTRLGSSIGVLAAAMIAPSGVTAQDYVPDIDVLDDAEVRALPSNLRDAPVTVRTMDENGVETITRTRYIERAPQVPPQAPHQTATYPAYAGYGHGYSVAPHAYSYGHSAGSQVFSREQWIEACEDRTRGRRGKEKGGIIGGLLGAVAGGIIGNRAYDSERLGGTLIGAGLGGIGGVLLGSLIGGGRNDRGEYDCEAALDGYLSQYAHGNVRYASRSIPARAPVAAPVYHAPHYQGYHYGYAAPQYYYYQAPQQIVYVPVEYQQRQRVVVRETVREEVIPGARRTIPPAPVPIKAVPIKTAPRPVKSAPTPVKVAPRPIKGN